MEVSGRIDARDRMQRDERTAQQVISRRRKAWPKPEQVDWRRIPPRLRQARAGPSPKSLDARSRDAVKRRRRRLVRSEQD
jgi:hypothetical protein